MLAYNGNEISFLAAKNYKPYIIIALIVFTLGFIIFDIAKRELSSEEDGINLSQIDYSENNKA